MSGDVIDIRKSGSSGVDQVFNDYENDLDAIKNFAWSVRTQKGGPVLGHAGRIPRKAEQAFMPASIRSTS